MTKKNSKSNEVKVYTICTLETSHSVLRSDYSFIAEPASNLSPFPEVQPSTVQVTLSSLSESKDVDPFPHSAVMKKVYCPFRTQETAWYNAQSA